MNFLLPLAYWVHDLDPVLVQFTEELAIRWYGVAYLAGFFASWLLLRYYVKRGLLNIQAGDLENLFFALIIGVLVGGRFGYLLFYDLSGWLGDPLRIFRVWEGGMASHGGFIGVLIAACWFAWSRRISPLRLGDFIVTVVPPGLFFGRLANFINGELWGKVSDVSWAVIFPQSAPADYPVDMIPPRHPSQLYEAALEGLVLFIYLQWRFWKSSARNFAGMLTGEFLIGYGILRIIGEQFREPDAALIAGMSRGSFYSIFVVIIGIGFIFYARRFGNAGNKTDSQS